MLLESTLVLVFHPVCTLLGTGGRFSRSSARGKFPRNHAVPIHGGCGARGDCAALVGRRFKLEKSKKGISYAVLNGILSGIGGLTLFAAYHTNGNTSLITVVTSLYPIITVGLAVLILRERLSATQALGLAFAGAAIVLFSL